MPQMLKLVTLNKVIRQYIELFFSFCLLFNFLTLLYKKKSSLSIILRRFLLKSFYGKIGG